MILETITLSSLGLGALHHLGYPLLLKAARELAHSPSRPEVAWKELPAITLLMPAYQEAEMIGPKLENLARLRYPAGQLTIRVICDGCTDGTAAAAETKRTSLEARGFRLEIIDHPENHGKVLRVNEGLASVTTPIVAFSDVSADLAPDALMLTGAWFQDSSTGVVAGGYDLDQPMNDGEAAYWRYQTAIKKGEAALGSPLGVHGSFYAVRAALARPLAPDTINDDFILPMSIVAKGYRAVYDTDIKASEREKTVKNQEFKRRMRIAAGNAQQVLRLASLLRPKHKGTALCFWLGKALRAVMAPLLGVAFLGSAWLAPESGLFAGIVAIMAAGLGLAGLSASGVTLPLRLRGVGSTLAYLALGHLAGLIGLSRYLFGAYRQPWRRAAL